MLQEFKNKNESLRTKNVKEKTLEVIKESTDDGYSKSIIQYSNKMIGSYKEPMTRMLDSTSGLLSTGIASVTNKVTKFQLIEQHVPWLISEELAEETI